MKKLIMVLALAVAGAALAETSYLYWQVDVTDAPQYAFDYLTLKDENGGAVNFAVQGSTDVGTMALADGGERGLVASDLWSDLGAGGLIGSTYLVEFYQFGDGQDTVVGKSFLSTSVLAAFVYSDSMRASGSGSAFTVNSTMVQVPEPTGGLLMVVGLAMLGLRRKRV